MLLIDRATCAGQHSGGPGQNMLSPLDLRRENSVQHLSSPAHYRRRDIVAALALAVPSVLLSACGQPAVIVAGEVRLAPPATPTVTPTLPSTSTPVPTATAPPTPTATATLVPTATRPPNPTATATTRPPTATTAPRAAT